MFMQNFIKIFLHDGSRAMGNFHKLATEWHTASQTHHGRTHRAIIGHTPKVDWLSPGCAIWMLSDNWLKHFNMWPRPQDYWAGPGWNRIFKSVTKDAFRDSAILPLNLNTMVGYESPCRSRIAEPESSLKSNFFLHHNMLWTYLTMTCNLLFNKALR